MLPAGTWAAPGVWKEDITDGGLFPRGWDYIAGCRPWLNRPVRTGLSLAQHAGGVGSGSGSAPASSVYRLGLDGKWDWKHASDLSCGVLVPLTLCFFSGECGSRFQDYRYITFAQWS